MKSYVSYARATVSTCVFYQTIAQWLWSRTQSYLRQSLHTCITNKLVCVVLLSAGLHQLSS